MPKNFSNNDIEIVVISLPLTSVDSDSDDGALAFVWLLGLRPFPISNSNGD